MVIERVQEIVAEHRAERGALLPVLHAVEDEFGHVSPLAVRAIAEGLNLSRAEVLGVLSFYRDFHQRPQSPVAVRVCRGEACQAVGAEALVADLALRLGAEVGGTTADGAVGLESVFCFGNCALGPTVQAGGRLFGRVEGARLDQVLAAVAEAAR